jgi:competence protein ComFC
VTNAHWSYPLYRLAWSGLDWLFPPRCGGCGEAGSRWCDECQKKVPILTGSLCGRCGRPNEGGGICFECRSNPPSFHALRAWAAFDFPIRQAIIRLKYKRDLGLGDILAVPLAQLAQSLDWPVDIVAPVPSGRKRLRERGYNQVELIARPFSLAMGLDYCPKALKRKRETISQVGLSAIERQENVRDAFIADSNIVGGKTILVMDDVSTTGSTLSSCSDALFRAGVKDVFALTVARALPHHGLQQV